MKDYKEEARKKIKEITNKKNVLFTKRGNEAILIALKESKKQGRKKLIIQDQGGWLTYEPFGKRTKHEIIKIKTKKGVITEEELKRTIKENQLEEELKKTTIIINKLPAYAYEQKTDFLKKYEKKGLMIITDISGSIKNKKEKKETEKTSNKREETEETEKTREREEITGTIIIGSFGPGKPIPLGRGGFIASDEELPEKEEPEINYEKLNELIETLEERKKKIKKIKEETYKELKKKGYKPIKSDEEGYNIIVPCEGEEKERLIKELRVKKLEYVECPKTIRLMIKGISIEIKRKFNEVQ